MYRKTGLSCSICAVMGADRDPAHEDEAIQKSGVAYLKHCIDAAVTMNARALVGPLYSAVGRTWQATAEQRKRDLERCVRNLKQVAKYAEDKGVTLALEPLNRFETSFINLTDQALELARMVDSPRVKLMMDTFHANIEEKSLGKAIEAAGPLMVHVHANENDRGTPGTGHVAWNEIAAALKKINFDGAMVIESFSTEVKEIARAAAVWRPLAPTPDGLARDGLAFLKRLMA
jgi:D-psicose/D-tagatose/L-ribulose 3-epimerase